MRGVHPISIFRIWIYNTNNRTYLVNYIGTCNICALKFKRWNYVSHMRDVSLSLYCACAHFFSLSMMSRAMRGVMPVCSSTSTPT